MADDTTTTSNTQDLNELLRQSPFGRLLDIQGADGNTLGVADIFGNLGAPGGNNSFSGGAGFDANSPYGGNPFAGDNFWNIFAGGVNPSNPSSGGGLPGGNAMTGGGFSGGNIPQGLPTGASTPVPEPSSVLGLAVIGVGIAATKFRQYQRRAVKTFNK